MHLFSAFVRPILEYGSVVWSPFTNLFFDRIERIQRKFCKCLRYCRPSESISSTNDVYRIYNINSLESRRQVVDLAFFFKAVNGIIDSPEILADFDSVCPRNGLRTRRLLSTEQSSKNVYHKPSNRIARLVNHYGANVDFFFELVHHSPWEPKGCYMSIKFEIMTI